MIILLLTCTVGIGGDNDGDHDDQNNNHDNLDGDLYSLCLWWQEVLAWPFQCHDGGDIAADDVEYGDDRDDQWSWWSMIMMIVLFNLDLYSWCW